MNAKVAGLPWRRGIPDGIWTAPFLLDGLSDAIGRAPEGDPLTEAPPAGTPLVCALAGALEHSGVYLGGGLVAELHGSGELRSVPLSVFLNGDPGDLVPVRTGTRILAACDAKTGCPLGTGEVEERARRRTARKGGKFPRVDYHLLQRNCHRFTAGCVCGKFVGWGPGPWPLPRLEKVIAHTLAASRRLMWREVPGTTPGFMYVPSQEKMDVATKVGGAVMRMLLGGTPINTLIAIPGFSLRNAR